MDEDPVSVLVACVSLSSQPKSLSAIGTQTRWKTRFRTQYGSLQTFILTRCSARLLLDKTTQMVRLKPNVRVSTPSTLPSQTSMSASVITRPAVVLSNHTNNNTTSVSPSTIVTAADDLSSSIQKEFECIICLEVADNAVDCSTCHVVCCESCSTRLSSCPHCRKQPAIFSANVALRRLISRLPYTCERCGELTSKETLSNHLREHCFPPSACPNNGCAVVLKRRMLTEHEQTCGFVMVSCSSCAQEIRRNDITRHTRICPCREITCRHCSEQVEYRYLNQHNTEDCQINFQMCADCAMLIHSADVSAHRLSCEERLVSCLYCEQMIPFSTQSSDLLFCPLRPVLCGFCQRNVTAESLDKHFMECTRQCSHCLLYVAAEELQEHTTVCATERVSCARCRELCHPYRMFQHESSCSRRYYIRTCLFIIVPIVLAIVLAIISPYVYRYMCPVHTISCSTLQEIREHPKECLLPESLWTLYDTITVYFDRYR
eukprot:GILJ01006865.1.p1 GENE.GILJ01006865.1~~GILJ01006865.1.p1  ORF type:complete len:489 (+),score=5.02 GILJ01006865.1:76-1542(+)